MSKLHQAAAFIDLDGTLCEIYLWQGLFAHHQHNQFKRTALYRFIAYHFPIWLLYEAKVVSKKSFYVLHATNLAWLLKGVSIERADLIWDWVIEHQLMPHLRSKMLDVIHQHKDDGHRILLMSGSFEPVVRKLAQRLGLDGAIATPLEIEEERYTGRIIPPLNVGEGKVVRLRQYLHDAGGNIHLTRSYFYTDSIVDVPVMRLFKNPIAVNPDDPLRELAKGEGWRIIED